MQLAALSSDVYPAGTVAVISIFARGLIPLKNVLFVVCRTKTSAQFPGVRLTGVVITSAASRFADVEYPASTFIVAGCEKPATSTGALTVVKVYPAAVGAGSLATSTHTAILWWKSPTTPGP